MGQTFLSVTLTLKRSKVVKKFEKIDDPTFKTNIRVKAGCLTDQTKATEEILILSFAASGFAPISVQIIPAIHFYSIVNSWLLHHYYNDAFTICC